MSEIKPDIVNKAALFDQAKGDQVGTAENPLPLEPEHIDGAIKLCDTILPESIGDRLDRRFAAVINKVYAAGHQNASGIIPIVDTEHPNKIVGYVNPSTGFYASREAMETAVNTAFQQGVTEGIHRVHDEQAAAEVHPLLAFSKQIPNAYKQGMAWAPIFFVLSWLLYHFHVFGG